MDAALKHSDTVNLVQEAVAGLRTQIESALTRGSALPAGVTLDAEMVTMSLGLIFDGPLRTPTTIQWRLSGVDDPAPPAHSVTVQFRVRNTAVPSESLKPQALVSGSPPVPAARSDRKEWIAKACLQVLGVPGFDTSARAEVLGDCLSNLVPADAIRVLEWCHTETRPPSDHPLWGKLGQVRTVLGYSPLGAPSAAGVLLELLQTVSIDEVIVTLGERWKYGTHWLPPGEAAEPV